MNYPAIVFAADESEIQAYGETIILRRGQTRPMVVIFEEDAVSIIRDIEALQARIENAPADRDVDDSLVDEVLTLTSRFESLDASADAKDAINLGLDALSFSIAAHSPTGLS